MNPHTGQTTPVDLERQAAADKALWREEQERAARELDLEDPDDLVLLEGKRETVEQVASDVAAANAARAKARRRAANKRARQQRRRNRR